MSAVQTSREVATRSDMCDALDTLSRISETILVTTLALESEVDDTAATALCIVLGHARGELDAARRVLSSLLASAVTQ